MSNEAHYFKVLSAGIAQVEADSFEARGIVYDRLWNIVVENLQEKGSDFEEVLAHERAAFLAAIKRIEFGEHPETRPRTVSAAPQEQSQPRRRFYSRIATRLLGAIAVLLIVGMGYLIVHLDPVTAERWAKESPPESLQSKVMRAVASLYRISERRSAPRSVVAQRAVLYEEGVATATGATFSGQAVWRPTAEGGASINIEIPQKNLLLRVSIARSSVQAGAISHLIEFRFFNPDESLSGAVEGVVGVLMKNDELSPGIELVGKVIQVQPGFFLMGLSGARADLERNTKLLSERPWLDIPIILKGGMRSLLAVEKGATGQNAINVILRPAEHG